MVADVQAQDLGPVVLDERQGVVDVGAGGHFGMMIAIGWESVRDGEV